MKPKKYFLQLVTIFALLTSFSLPAFGDIEPLNNECNGELISELNSISVTTSHTESGKLPMPNDDDDYYYFKPGVAGTLSVIYSSDKKTNLNISKIECDKDDVVEEEEIKNYSTSIAVSSLQTIYIQIERENNGLINYDLKMTFTVDSSPPPPTAICDTFTGMFQTHGTCNGVSGTGTALDIEYENEPTEASVSDSPSPSNNSQTVSGTTSLSGSQYDTITTSYHTNTSTTFNINNSLKINTMRMTSGNTFNFTGSNPYSLDIGTFGTGSYGANTITSNNKATDININTLSLVGGSTVDLSATQSINMESFTVGRGSTVALKAPYVNINDMTFSESGSGTSNINIIADYIDIEDLSFSQNSNLTITPFTPGKRVLFRSKKIDATSSSSMIVSSGDYYTKTFNIPGTSGSSSIIAKDSNQLINLFINGDFDPGNNPGINSLGKDGDYGNNPASKFFIFINGDLETGGGGTTFNATIYVEEGAEFGNPTYIKGALSAGDCISIGQGEFIFDESINDTEYGECDGGGTPTVIGNFNTVHAGAVDVNNSSDPEDPLALENALYTQIVGKVFTVDIISLDSDNITPIAFDGNVTLSIVEDGDCSVETPLLWGPNILTFSDEKYRPAGVTPTKASKNARFKMATEDATLCSRDSFAIRPATYTIDANETGILVGGRSYNFTFTALNDGASAVTSDYNQTIYNALDKNATTQLIVPAGCDTLDTTVKYTSEAIPFIDGQASVDYTYAEVGEISLTLSDNDWTSVDRDKGDCIDGSTQNTLDGSSKVGCMIQATKPFTFVPEKFTSTLTLANGSNDQRFTYISNEQNMSAPLALTATARLDGGGVATNYTANCFSRDITTEVIIDTPQTGVKFFGELAQNTNTATFSTTEGNFSSGETTINFSVNFDRDESISINPFNIARNDFNITQIIDTDGVQGSDFNRTGDMNATFVYGRANASRQRYSKDEDNIANIYFEIYCDNTCNRDILPNEMKSIRISDTRWFINGLHEIATDGNVTIVVQKGGTNAITDIVTATDYPIENPSKTTLNYNGSKGHPYKTTMQIGASPWLIYKDNEFQVEFDKATVGWGGQHETNTTTRDIDSAKTNRRIMW